MIRRFTVIVQLITGPLKGFNATRTAVTQCQGSPAAGRTEKEITFLFLFLQLSGYVFKPAVSFFFKSVRHGDAVNRFDAKKSAFFRFIAGYGVF